MNGSYKLQTIRKNLMGENFDEPSITVPENGNWANLYYKDLVYQFERVEDGRVEQPFIFDRRLPPMPFGTIVERPEHME